ncbi:hypothetical protein [Polyangium sorediatum]|uniref:FHA domain-containing protein n=1 Tax=Polyangium sorediatum TaxID=889274 RepID=A0ABT6NN47_9BACT|nr:hypothetical protein [Polyangium sorediatum]MDI1429750.1 hypothetical protein [Polyangium sorediatum]
MAKEPFFASRTEGEKTSEGRDVEAADGAHKALELVALRGTEVLGVRHVLDGGVCWIGQAPESIARIPMTEYGGHPVVVAEVKEGQFVLHVPPHARGRTHGKDGLGRLVTGPVSFEVDEGDRAVIVLGPVQIRARLVAIEASGKERVRIPNETRRLLTVMGALYVTALALCAAIAPARPERLANGAVRRAIATVAESVVSVNAARELDRP